MRRLFFVILFLLVVAGCGPQRDDAQSILFLCAEAEGSAQLHSQSLDGESRQLTGVDDPASPEIIDFAAAPDGERIVYSVVVGEGSTALRIVDSDGDNDVLLLDCPAAECAAPVWSPDGQRLLFERGGLEDTVTPGPPRLYWLDPNTGATAPLIEGDDTPASGARFSPDGAWLSYVSPADEGIILYRLADGEQRLMPSRTGTPAAWSPDGAAVVYSDIVPQANAPDPEGVLPPQETAGVYLYRTLLAGAESRQRLSPDAAVADGGPAYSPDGAWIAFTRAPAETGAGRQLWLMRPDGGEARPLTDEPGVTHGPPSWSADGRYLLFQRFDLSDPEGRPSIWLMDVATGEARLVAEEGYLPVWSR
jgi:TolB protein